MVNFTKSVSNEQMTSGLKRLLAMNADLADQYEGLNNEQTKPESREQLAELAEMHRRHTDALSDSLLFLGAAPDPLKRANRGRHFPHMGGIRKAVDGAGLSSLRSREENLRQAYLEELEQLKASDEVVNVINELLDETDKVIQSRLNELD